MGSVLIIIINLFVQVYTILILISVVMSYILSPYDPVRQFIDRLVNPLLDPIRKIVPPVGMFDFSPIVLMLVVQFVGQILTSVLSALR
jgi:YggT family protein